MLKPEVIVNLQDEFWTQSEQLIPGETWESWFGIWLENLADYLPEADSYEVSLRLTDDENIAQFNSQYRNIDRPTDVLAFAALEAEIPWSEELNNEPLYLGDLIISVETAKIQAQNKGHSLGLELAWLASHGCLHLLGWDHRDDESLELMLSEQEKLLELVGLSFDLLK